MRNSYRKLKQDGKNILEAEKVGVPGTEKSEGDIARAHSMRQDGVGVEVEVGEFGLGKAPSDSRPVNKIELSKEQEAAIQEA